MRIAKRYSLRIIGNKTLSSRKNREMIQPNPFIITVILFDGRLSEREIPSFRGAVMGIAGNDPLFHNHSEDAKDINRYPRIQYKLIDGYPAVLGVMEGADAVKRLFIPGGKHIMRIGSGYREFAVQEVQEDTFSPSIKEGQTNRYSLRSWLPFNSENFEEFQGISSLAGRIAKLDEILTGNILSLYKAFDAYVEDRIVAHVVDLIPRSVSFKGVRMQAYDAVIESNFALPVHCGIGKGVSHGFGVLEK